MLGGGYAIGKSGGINQNGGTNGGTNRTFWSGYRVQFGSLYRNRLAGLCRTGQLVDNPERMNIFNGLGTDTLITQYIVFAAKNICFYVTVPVVFSNRQMKATLREVKLATG